MELELRLSKSNISLLKRMVPHLFEGIKRIHFKKNGSVIVLSKGLFKQKYEFQVAEFLLNIIINKLQEKAKYLNVFCPIPKFHSIAEAVVYFKQFDNDYFSVIYNIYSDIVLSHDMNETFEETCLTKVEIAKTTSTCELEPSFVKEFLSKIKDKIDKTIILIEESYNELIFIGDSASRAPPIIFLKQAA